MALVVSWRVLGNDAGGVETLAGIENFEEGLRTAPLKKSVETKTILRVRTSGPVFLLNCESWSVTVYVKEFVI